MLTDDEIRALREKSQYLAGYHGPHEVYPVHRYELHELCTRLLSAEARVKALERAARNIKPYLVWTIGPESPGHHPTMPSAVGAFLAALQEQSK
jgi:hypothetical protein